MKLRLASHFGLGRIVATLALLLLVSSTAPAQSITNFWNTAVGGDWNTAGNWSLGSVPGVATNANITTNVANQTITYTAPMTASSIQSLAISNTLASSTNALSITAGGF